MSTAAVRLTAIAKRAGCAAKHPPGYLLPLLSKLPRVTDPNVLIGSATADDAAIYRLSDDTALVLTTDFFTPVVDDPYDFGAVAAANALSDVYAMGGRPLTALNIVGFPDADLDVVLDGAPPQTPESSLRRSASLHDVDVLGEILRGGAEKAKEAGIDIVGGHTIKADEPIYGLAVTGTVHPARIVSNAGAKPGDVLVLTKPIGIGIITTAAKREEDRLNAIREAIRLMTTLNRSACEAMIEMGASIHAATDITGFGLLGHLRNIVAASKCAAVIENHRVPVIDAAATYVKEGIAPGGTHANLRFLSDGAWVDYNSAITKEEQLLLCDAQTSGGLLIAVEEKKASALVRLLEDRGTPCAAVIGQIEESARAHIRVVA